MMRIALCLIKRLGWWCEDMQSFKNYYLVGTVPLSQVQVLGTVCIFVSTVRRVTIWDVRIRTYQILYLGTLSSQL